MVHPSFQPLRTSEPEDDDCEPGEWDGAEDDILMERFQPSAVCGSSRQVRPTFAIGRLGLGVLRNGKVAGAVTATLAVAVAGTLLLAERQPRAAPADGLRAAWARTRDSVEEDGFVQTVQTGQQAAVPVGQAQGVYYQASTVVQNGSHGCPCAGGSAVSHGCHCCCKNCGCNHGSVAYCSSMVCPIGHFQREGAEHIECKGIGGMCTVEADLSLCCNRRATCDAYACQPGYLLRLGAAHISCANGSAFGSCGPEDSSTCCELRGTCDDYECPSGTTLKPHAQHIMCAGASCSQSDCCKQIPTATPEVPPEVVDSTTSKRYVDVEVPEQDILLCDLNCFDEGVDSVSVELPEDEVKSLDSCRTACTKNEECSGVVYRKDFQTTGESTCLGKKDIHISLCQPGGDFYTEILKHRPLGKCALLGDPHIVQWDRPPHLGKPTFDDYDSGDYVLMASKELTIHARFGFTERFPSATSTKGIAVHGSKISDKALVAGYSEELKRFVVWYDGQEIIKSKGESFDDGLLVARYDDMDPSEFHSEARHTIGEDAENVASWTFEWKAVPLKIYMLLGPDNVNAVLEMQKLEFPMDGLCGNFDCNPDDEDLAALVSRGLGGALSWQDSNFHFATGTFHEKDFVKGSGNEDVLANCDQDLLAKGREACGAGKGVDDAQAKACLFDVCEAKSVDVAAIDVETVSIEQDAEPARPGHDAVVVPAEPGQPREPGCYVWLPTGCKLKPMSGDGWIRDVWGEQNANAGVDREACTASRKAQIGEWCGVSDAKMAFVEPAEGF